MKLYRFLGEGEESRDDDIITAAYESGPTLRLVAEVPDDANLAAALIAADHQAWLFAHAACRGGGGA